MSTIDVRGTRPRFGYGALLLPVFAGALFTSAVLLFSVQPMFTKMVLPLLGGTPAVWSVGMVFFQAVLLLGYVYAHGLTRLLDPRGAMIAHVAVLIVAFTTLPIAVAASFGNPPSDGAAFWLIGLFAASIGLPFFAVAANAPMLQAWFARTDHRQAHDPYFLYGASNLGSFAALIAYPLLLEPIFTLRAQTRLWSAGFVLLIALVAAAGMLLAMTMRGAASARRDEAAPARAVTWRDRLLWTGLAFVPSALLLAVTSHISTDIAAAPFLWVIPLALYLATFVFTFRAGGDGVHYWMVRLQPLVVAPLAIGLMWGEREFWVAAILLDLAVLLISAMICHRELFLRRPDASHLTEFYMWLSFGGVLGGMFSGLLAPNIFPDVWEYPILIVLALLCRPGTWAAGATAWRKEGIIIAALIAVTAIPGLVFGVKLPAQAELVWMVLLVGLAIVIMLQADRPVRLAGLTAFVLVLTAVYQPGVVRTETARSFFGVHKVVESYDGRFRTLYHGTTIHGAERIRDDDGTRPLAGRPEPLTYFYFGGPYSEAIAAVRATRGSLDRVAVVGLGTGTLACHAVPGEKWRYYEIDPVVVRIAQDESKFTFLSKCAPGIDVVLGDARLTLADEPGLYDIIILDAFTSDAIPVHLMTREAMALYLSKLAKGGAILFNISNRYLEMASVVAETAAAQGLVTYVKRDNAISTENFKQTMRANALIAVVARREEDVAALKTYTRWHRWQADGSVRAWTDDYSNILAAIVRMMR